MDSFVIYLSWMLLAIIHVGKCVVTDKEYARLPPVFELDHYDRCMLLEDEALYCSIDLHLKPIQADNPSTTWIKIQELNSSPKNYHHDHLRHGICVPFTCPNITRSHKDPLFKNDLEKCYNKKYESDGVYGTIGYIHCQTNDPIPFDFYDIAVLIFLVTYISFVIYASFYEGVARYKSPEEYQKITGTPYGKLLSCFSIPKNWYRLTTVNQTPEMEPFKPIQGIRLYNMMLVIVAHAGIAGVIGPASNTLEIEQMCDKAASVFLASGPYAVETFFLISSLLLTYQIFLNFDEQSGRDLNVKTLGWILLNRYIRLTAPLAVVLAVNSTLVYHLGRGPWWDALIGTEMRNCRQNAWTNLLYINNLINPSKMCISQTWYLAVDTHGFILALAILYFVVKKPKRLWWVIPTVWIVVQGIFLKKMYEKDIESYLKPYPENLYRMNAMYETDGVWINTIAYTPPHMVGTLVGLTTGYIYYKYRNQRIRTTKIHTIAWWFLSFGAGVSIILFPGMWMFSENFYHTKWFSLPHLCLGTTIYGCAIATGIFGMSQGLGWMAKWVSEWSPTYVLGRITYTTFLAHYFFIVFKVGTIRELSYFTDFSVISQSIEIIACSLILGLLLCLVIELPVTSLQGVYLKTKVTTRPKRMDNGTRGSVYKEDDKDKE